MSSKRIWHQYYDEGVRPELDYPELNLFQLLQLAVEENPLGTAMIFYKARTTYQKLARLVDRFADGLASLGVEKGTRVALVLPNIPGYVVAHFAIQKLGAIAVPTNPLYVERELEHQLNDSGAEVVVIFDQLLARLEKVRASTGVRSVITMGVQDFLPPLTSRLYAIKNRRNKVVSRDPAVIAYRSFMTRKHEPSPGVRVTMDDTALLLYTGGTTGASKGAMLTQRNLVCNAKQTRVWLWSMEDRREVLLCVLPFFHSYGLTTGMHLAVISQAAMVLLPRFELADVAKAIQKYRPTVFCAVPSMYNAVSRYQKLTEEDLSCIRLCISGGAALPAEVQKRFEALTGGKLVEGYGLTETSPVAAVNPTHGHRKAGTIGIPISDTLACIVDPETKEPREGGRVGELAVKGPQVMQGYWRRPEETAEVLHDGWLYTGDLAEQDEEGFIRIVDRKKDVIISAGMNVYPREVEEVLHEHPKVVEAAVVGEPSSVRGEVVKAFVVLEEGEELTKAELVGFCRDKLSKYKVPRRVEIVLELPKSAMGKVLKRVLREENAVKGEELGPPGSTA